MMITNKHQPFGNSNKRHKKSLGIAFVPGVGMVVMMGDGQWLVSRDWADSASWHWP